MFNKTGKCRWIIVLLLFIGFGVAFSGSESRAASLYRVKINKQQNCITIYKLNQEGKYDPYKAMVCSVGAATPLGTFPLKEKIRWHELDGPVYGQYCSRITGHILFHSVWYAVNNNPATVSCTQYNKLGDVASHGCVRVCVRDAKWIYENIPSGTPVEIYNAKEPGPLGKPEAIKLPGYWGWDPTDETNPANPYNNKKPVITFRKGSSTNIKYASAKNILKDVTAKNTTGFDASDKITYTVRYKTGVKAKPRKVKRINTKRDGIYVVQFKVTDEIGRKAALKVNYKVLGQVFVKSMKLNTASKTLYIGGDGSDESFRLKMQSCKPYNASIKDVAFKSFNTNVVRVDSKGNIKAAGNGKARIRVRAKDGSGVKAYCTVEVRTYAESVNASIDSATLNVGGETYVRASVAPVTATGRKNMSYTYTSSNPGVVSVDADGRVRAIAAGNAVITVKALNAAQKGELVTQVEVTVNPDAGSEVSESAMALN